MGRLIDVDEYEKRIKPYDTEDVIDKALYNFAHDHLVTTPTAQPHTEADIQKMQDLEQAELEKAFELGREDALSEIVRCKECKHSEHWYRDKRRCFLWVEDGIAVFDDGFCNYGERKEDATD